MIFFTGLSGRQVESFEFKCIYNVNLRIFQLLQLLNVYIILKANALLIEIMSKPLNLLFIFRLGVLLNNQLSTASICDTLNLNLIEHFSF